MYSGANSKIVFFLGGGQNFLWRRGFFLRRRALLKSIHILKLDMHVHSSILNIESVKPIKTNFVNLGGGGGRPPAPPIGATSNNTGT